MLKEQRSSLQPSLERGSVLTEMALALPVFLLLLGAVFDFGFLYQGESGMTRGLYVSARQAGISATQESNSDIECLFEAGNAFLDELERYGSPRRAVEHQMKGIKEPVILSLLPGPDIAEPADPAQTFTISTWFKPPCYFCRFTQLAVDDSDPEAVGKRVRQALVARPIDGGCTPNMTSGGRCSISDSDEGSYRSWTDATRAGRRIVFSVERKVYCCHGDSCTQVQVNV